MTSRFIQKPSRPKAFFLGLLAVSFVLHLLFFSWQLFFDEPKPERPKPIEVKLLTEPKPVAPSKKAQPKEQNKASKTSVTESPKSKPKEQQESAKSQSPKPSPKEPVKPVFKPSAQIQPQLGDSGFKPSTEIIDTAPSGLSAEPGRLDQEASFDQFKEPSPPSTEGPTSVNPKGIDQKRPRTESAEPGITTSELEIATGTDKETEPDPTEQPGPGPPARKGPIEGELANRRILFKPSPPPMKLDREVTIKLRFWVRPDGSVDRAIPVIKGESALEELAIRLLSDYRFSAVAPQKGMQEGIIYFTLRPNP